MRFSFPLPKPPASAKATIATVLADWTTTVTVDGPTLDIRVPNGLHFGRLAIRIRYVDADGKLSPARVIKRKRASREKVQIGKTQCKKINGRMPTAGQKATRNEKPKERPQTDKSNANRSNSANSSESSVS